MRGPLGRAVLVDLMGARPDVLASDVGLSLGGQPYSVQRPASDRVIGASSSKRIEALGDEQNRQVARSINLLVEERLPTVKESLKNSPDVMRRVGETIEHYAYGPAELWQPFREALVLAQGSISHIAEAVAATSDLDWWWGKMSAQDQKWIGDPNETTSLAPTPVKPIEPSSDEQRSWWWVSPVRSDLLRTTRGPVGPYTSVASICRSGYETAQCDRLETWAVQIPESVEVYEVLCAEDWVSLVENYPRPCVDGRNSEWTRWTRSEGPWLLPDWDSIARDFDGVHVSLAAYLASAFRALPAGEAQTVLIGWNPDETLWLRSRPVLWDRLEVHNLG